MNKAMLAWVFLVVAGAGWCQGAPQVTTLKLVIATRQQTALVGEPVYFSAQVTNEGPITAIVKVNSGDVMGPWLYMGCCKEALVIQAPDGHIHYGAFSVLYAVLKPGETKSTSDANCDGLVLSQPGHYNVWAELESTGVSAEPTVSPNPPRYDYFWKGHAISNACSIDILAPTGVDAAAYQAFKGNPLAHPVDLLKRFPTSTYAAYVVYGVMHGFAGGDQPMFLRSIETGSYLSNSYPDDTGKSKDGWRSLSGEQAAQWWVKWINIILSNHPDIWFADRLRLKRAVDQVALKNYQVGAADLQTLSQQANPDVAQKAQAILGEMKQKGWIQN